MDWADDLTYAIHDIEDFYRAGIVPLHALRPPESGSAPDAETEADNFLDYVSARKRQINPLADLVPEIDQIFRGTFSGPFSPWIDPTKAIGMTRARLRSFTSILVGRYINGLS